MQSLQEQWAHWSQCLCIFQNIDIMLSPSRCLHWLSRISLQPQHMFLRTLDFSFFHDLSLSDGIPCILHKNRNHVYLRFITYWPWLHSHMRSSSNTGVKRLQKLILVWEMLINNRRKRNFDLPSLCKWKVG